MCPFLCLLYVKLEYERVKAMQMTQANEAVKQEHMISLEQSI